MTELSTTEHTMWEQPIKEAPDTMSDPELNEKYKAGEHRIVTETNRE